MTTWTDTARQRLDQYFESIRGTLHASGADPDEVTDDLRRHIDAEIAARRLDVVTEEDIRHILGRIGAPEAAPGTAPVSPAGADVSAAPAAERPPRFALLLGFGVILPLVTLAIELFTHMCAGVFFDPIPSVWHVLMVLAVPAANLWVWRALRQPPVRRARLLGWANGFAAGIGGFYSIVFIPILPFALVGLFYLGGGLLPMAPLLATITAVVLRGHLRRVASGAPAGMARPVSGFWPGVGLAALALVLTVLPITLTRYWAQQAAAEAPSVRAGAIRWLRALGREDILLGDCYGATTWMRQSPLDLHLFGVPTAPEQARATFFRVTGQPFNVLPPPQLNFTRGGWNIFDEFTWDRDQGGAAVGSRVKGLSLVSSRLDGLVEGDAALGYVEWTLEFRNTSQRAQEARAQVALPPGGVVSRLTLWVNGEEREAAFAGSGQVRAAYQEVAIRRRRDPVLVTSAGPDRVLVQCFPVPADGGTMKVRLGITAPLVLPSQESAVLRWPHFLERNFSLADEVQHAIWMESRSALESRAAGLRAEAPSDARCALRGQLSDRELAEPGSALRLRRSAAVTLVWTTEGLGTNTMVEQHFRSEPAGMPARIVLIVDASRSMAGHLGAIADALQQLPDGLELSVLLAGDEVRALLDKPARLNAALRVELATRLRALRAQGGQDNLPALIQGWDIASMTPGGIVVWIHGPQPVLLDSTDTLAQRFLWRGVQTRWYDFQISPGPNRILEKLHGAQAVLGVPRIGSVAEDLGRFLATVSGRSPAIAAVREKTTGASVPAGDHVRQATKHLARLWAFEEVGRLAAGRSREAAVQLASQFQLVTPVSGAVVLETQEQYARAGLEAVAAESVPSVPEPAGLWWIAGALLVLVVGARRLVQRSGKPGETKGLS